MTKEKGFVLLDVLGWAFAGLMAIGASFSLMRADTCEGRGYKTAQGVHKIACAGTGACAGNCSQTNDTTSNPGLTITWCGCGAAAGAKMDCAKVSTKCTPVLLANLGGSVWLGCMDCNCDTSKTPPTLNGKCGVTSTIPVGSANATDTCICVTFDSDDTDEEGGGE
jgi:hypothetical protein